ncbi:MAG: glycosyltransferase family 4 protein [Microthrixaceae bacterium]
MRILVVAEQYPWPAVDGYRRRMDHVIRGLARAGQVDVMALHRLGTAEPADHGITGEDYHEVRAVAVPAAADRGLRDWLGRWIRSGLPRRTLGPDWSPLRTRLVGAPSSPRYDLVWFSHVDSWVGLRDVVNASHQIVDFDNLEDIALKLRRRVPPRFPPGAGVPQRLKIAIRWAVSRGFDAVDQRRWTRIQCDCGQAVDRVVVCSELDVSRSGCNNAVVIGNGADRPIGAIPDRMDLRSESPTMLFIGALDYEPNTEAVEWFVREVFPSVRNAVPAARARIVGRGSELLGWVDSVDGVDMVGSVPAVEPELLRADVSIVPIMVGAGTRLKVVEALANRIPIVTTTVGCEGIDLFNEVHGLVADDAAAFAAACTRLLTNGDLRQRLADNGAELFESTYDWELIERRIADLVIATI